MRIKLIASDIDGTLINTDHNVSEKTKKVIHRLRDEGIHFVLATGRAFDSTHRIAQQLELEQEDIGMICLNGMHTYNPITKEKRVHDGLNFEEALQFKNLGEKYHMGVMYCFDNMMYLEMSERSKEDYANARGEEVKSYFNFGVGIELIDSLNDIEELFEKAQLQKSAFIQTEDYMSLVIDRMKDETNADYTLMQVGPGWTEVAKSSVNKGAALIDYAAKRGIKPEEIMVFGDSENDISMFKVAGISVAMENAIGTAKENATHHTISNDDHGVAVFIEDYLNKLD